jgi:hypothetical protein
MKFLGYPEADRAAESIRTLGGTLPDDLAIRAFQERQKTNEQKQEQMAQAIAAKKEQREELSRKAREKAIEEASASGYAPSASAGSSGNRTVHVRGYTSKDGTYVRPHMRSR